MRIIKETVLNNDADIILFQEMKLANITQFKSVTFLPSNLQSLLSVDSDGASRGMLTAWNVTKFKLLTSISKPYSISARFETETNGTTFWISNLYGPNADEERPAFFQEIRDISEQIEGPWLLGGDFNVVRSLDERSTYQFSTNEALFNETI